MIHEANTKNWKLGDVVIHDADAKKRKMLMRVTGTTNDGRIITRYLDRQVSAERYENKPEVLHDPVRFSIETPNAVLSGAATEVKPRRDVSPRPPRTKS